MILSLALAAVIVVIDLVTKAVIYGLDVDLIGDFLRIESTLNSGASFGMMENSTVFFIVFTIPVVIAMIYIICSKKYLSNFNKVCLGIVLGGTLGNLVDRIALGGVRDFIALKGFAIFNVADIAITVGVAMFIIGLIVQIARSKKPQEQTVTKDDAKLEGLKAIRDELKAEKEAKEEESKKENNE